jgi:CheY-like chemotaxis protein
MNPSATILVVDDDADLRQSLVDLLEDEGYRTQAAASGREALAVLRGQDLPQLIILDLMMPDLNGWQFRDIQSTDPRLAAIPVLVVTAGRKMAQELVGPEVLFKPFSLDDLLAKVERLVHESEPRAPMA